MVLHLHSQDYKCSGGITTSYSTSYLLELSLPSFLSGIFENKYFLILFWYFLQFLLISIITAETIHCSFPFCKNLKFPPHPNCFRAFTSAVYQIG